MASNNKNYALQLMCLALLLIFSSCSERKEKRWFYIFDKDIVLYLTPEIQKELHEMYDEDIAYLRSTGRIEDAMEAGAKEEEINTTLEIDRGFCFLTKNEVKGDFVYQYQKDGLKFLAPAGSFRLMTQEDVMSARNTGKLPDGTKVTGPRINYHFRHAIRDYEVAQADDSWENYQAPGSVPLYSLWPLLIPVLLVMFFSYFSDIDESDKIEEVGNKWLLVPLMTVGAMALEIVFYFLFKGKINAFLYASDGHGFLVSALFILLFIAAVLVNAVAAFRVNSNIMTYYGLRVKPYQWIIAAVGLIAIWFVAGSFAKSIGVSSSQNVKLFRLVAMGIIALVYFGLIFFRQNRESIKALPIMAIFAIVLSIFMYFAFWIVLFLLIMTGGLKQTLLSGRGMLGDSDMRSSAEIRADMACSDCLYNGTDLCKREPGNYRNDHNYCWVPKNNA